MSYRKPPVARKPRTWRSRRRWERDSYVGRLWTPEADVDWTIYGPNPYDWSWVRPGLATGGMPTTRAEVDFLVAEGITHVVNCATEYPQTARWVLEADPRITYLANPEPDDYRPKETSWFARTIAFAVPAILAGANVLVHCVAGSNRGPSNAYAVARVLGHDAADAERLIRKARPAARLFYLRDADAAVGELM